MYEEIEFLCANSSYPGYIHWLRKHRELYSELQRNGLLPYRQDFSEHGNKQYSLAVIVLDPTARDYVLRAAKKVGLPVDVLGSASQSKVVEVERGVYDYQMPLSRKHNTITRIIRDILSEYHLTPQEINHGNCDEFAEWVEDEARRAGLSVQIMDNSQIGHVWVKHGGMNYDAETPEGVRSWLQLPIARRVRAELPHLLHKSFRTKPMEKRKRKTREVPASLKSV